MQSQIRDLETARISAGQNDRTKFDKSALEELAASIRDNGLAQPITVRPIAGDRYQIVAGERRYRAISQVLGLDTIPAIVRDLSDEQASAIMLAENVARADLDPIDEGRAYQTRIDEFGWSVKELGERAGVSAVRIRFRLKLLGLRDNLQKLIRDGQLPIGYAQILAGGDLDKNRQMIALAALRDNPSPTPQWFRKVVGKLLEEQSQESLFDTAAFFVAQEIAPEPVAYIDPPLPSTTTPPTTGTSLIEIIAGQIEYWNQAAGEWADLGHSFKRHECEAAAAALAFVLAAA